MVALRFELRQPGPREAMLSTELGGEFGKLTWSYKRMGLTKMVQSPGLEPCAGWSLYHPSE